MKLVINANFRLHKITDTFIFFIYNVMVELGTKCDLKYLKQKMQDWNINILKYKMHKKTYSFHHLHIYILQKKLKLKL